MLKLYDYGLIFWNPETDDEICAIFQARNYFDAEDIVEPVEVPGYHKGTITYLEDRNKSYYDTPLEDLIDEQKGAA